MDKRLLAHTNWSLLALTLVLFAVGAGNLYSASAVRLEDGIEVASYFQKQLIWGAAGFACMLLVTVFHYRHLRTLGLALYVISLILLLLVPFIGRNINGSTRWIDLGFISVQPSEMCKIAILLVSATFLARYKESLRWGDMGMLLGIIMLPALLIFKQPDLGTALLLLFLAGGMALYHGVRRGILITGLLALPPVFLLLWHFVLKTYHKSRILTFLDPTRDEQGAGYHTIQSQIAIGSGQLYGKGFQGGTQSLLRFLPEKHTDFAVAVFSEEWGFAGCTVLLALFCLFLLRIINTAQSAKDHFAGMLCAGIFFYFFWQILINIGMVLGVMPVVGIPLPFLSYGGTATIVNFIMIGLVLNVSMRRFMFKVH